MGDDDLVHATALAGFDDACSVLLKLRDDTRTGIATYQSETSKHDSLIGRRARTFRHSGCRSYPDSRCGRRKGPGRSGSILAPTLTLDEIMRFMATATEKVNDWSATHVSAISREEAAAGFDANLDMRGAASAGGASDPVGHRRGRRLDGRNRCATRHGTRQP